MPIVVVMLAALALAGCKAENGRGPAPQTGARTFVAENGADVARQIAA